MARKPARTAIAGPPSRTDLILFPVLVLTRTTRDCSLHATHADEPLRASVIVGQYGPAPAQTLTARAPGRPPLPLAVPHASTKAARAAIAAARLIAVSTRRRIPSLERNFPIARPEPTRVQMWAIAHPVRLHIWHLLVEGPSTASRLGRRLGESRSLISYHLRVLA